MTRIGEYMPRVSAMVRREVAEVDVAAADLTWTSLAMLVFLAQGDGEPSLVRRAAEAAIEDLDDLTVSDLSVELGPSVLPLARLAAVAQAAATQRLAGDVEGARTWIVRGLGGSDMPDSDWEPSVLGVMITEALSGSLTAVDEVASLAETLFYLANRPAYLTDLTDAYGPGLVAVLVSREHRPDLVSPIVQALFWANSRQLTPLVEELRGWCTGASRALPDPAVKIYIALALARTTGDKAERASLLGDLASQLDDETPTAVALEVLAASCEDDVERTLALLPRLVQVIAKHWTEKSQWLGSDEVRALKERTFDILGAPLSALTAAGHVHEVVRLLRSWLELPDADEPLSERVLVTLYQDPTLHGWSRGSCRASESVDTTQLAEVTNAALGSALVGSGSGGGTLAGPASGNRDASAGPQFLSTSRRLLGLDACVELTRRVAADSLWVPLPGLPIPYQAVMREHAPAPQIWVSLENPQPDRALKRALVIAGDSQLGETEARAVASTLSSAGVDVDLLIGNDATARMVLRALESPDFDLIWLAAHGRLPGYDHEGAKIWLRAGEEVFEPDLRVRPAGPSGRRLLVLSSCDSAAAVVASGPRRRGMAAAAAGGRQAMIGHQWPVNEQFAAAFGCVLAASLTTVSSFALAYNDAMNRIRAP